MLTMATGVEKATARLTLAYMAVALVALSLGLQPGERFALVYGGHVAMMALLALAAGVRTRSNAIATAQAWLPLLCIPLLYAELPYLMTVAGPSFGDAVVQRWETALWGGHPSRLLAGSLPYRWISELLHGSYLSYYAIIYLPLAWLWVQSRREALPSATYGRPVSRGFGEAALAVMTTFVLCFAVFVLFPVQGPRYLWVPEGIPAGPVRGAVLAILERGSSRGAAFPSSHMAVATVQALMAFRWRVPGRLLIAFLTAGLGVGAVYGGFHYAIDILAGGLLGIVVFATVRAYGPAFTA